MTIAAVRSAYRSRAGRRRAGAYSGYLAAMLLVVVVLPTARALAITLTDPAVGPALATVDLGALIAVAAGAAIPVAVLLGRARGPAVDAPHPTALLLATEARRWHVLRRSVVVSGALAAAAAALAATALALASGSPLLPAALAGAAFGVLLTVAALAGQCLTPPRSAVLAAVLVLPVLAVPALPFTPGGLVALAVAGAPSAAVSIVALAVLVVPLAPRLLDDASGPSLLAQSQRWRSAVTGAANGDVADALSGYRSLPRRNRCVQAVRVGPFPVTVVVRDAVGALRTPGRSAAAGLALLAAGAAVAVAAVAPPSLLAIPAALAGVLAYLGAGVWSDGFRHAAETAGQTAFVATPPFELLLLHGVLPLALALTLVTVGALLLSGGALAPAAATALVAVAARAMDATRGALPPRLLSPIPMPIGDGAGAAVLLWNLAAPLVSAGAAVAVVVAPGPLILAPVVALTCLLVARRRLASA
ncbi:MULTISPECIES: hypothetical protein [unclassified Rathayibacter]|uniref:hypothetical protein n=1 Tax=unclassified Rathayibacter TaxID=2609250 RepID=UPI0006F1C8A4|nr:MULTISPECIES: hypothetical protein [unclassified Rathayibacter]KQQ03990.1 hypothetical protein ASF42_11145 [Rathayibacter sp. Leaf294]KQS12444.1 hypothetical protein ASG06_11145 [Rathayibacter sp. Leaf185]